jgi:hypothetical protein
MANSPTPGKEQLSDTGTAATRVRVSTKTIAAAKSDKIFKPKKDKLVRDSFTMPESEYSLIAAVKRRCLAKGVAVKKSEVLRAAVIGFAALSDAELTSALQTLVVIKTGRPPQGKK